MPILFKWNRVYVYVGFNFTFYRCNLFENVSKIITQQSHLMLLIFVKFKRAY